MKDDYKKLHKDITQEYENYKKQKDNEIAELKYYNKELENEINYLNEKVENLENINFDLEKDNKNLKNLNNDLKNKLKNFEIENKSIVSSINFDKNSSNNINYKTFNNIDKLYNEIIKAKNYIQSNKLSLDKKLKIIKKKDKFEKAYFKIASKFKDEKTKINSFKNSNFKKKSYKNNIFESNNISEISINNFKNKEPNSDSKGNMFKSTFIDNNKIFSKKNSINISNLDSDKCQINDKIYEEKLNICYNIINSIKNIKI